MKTMGIRSIKGTVLNCKGVGAAHYRICELWGGDEETCYEGQFESVRNAIKLAVFGE